MASCSCGCFLVLGFPVFAILFNGVFRGELFSDLSLVRNVE